MKRIPVDSSNLASVGYEESQKILEVEFINGGIYQYFSVPVSVYQGLMQASSHGQYFDQNVKKANYRYKKVG